MLGGAVVKGRGAMPAIARQRLTAFSRSSRSISSFRSQTCGLPIRYGRNKQSLAGNLSWSPASSIPGMTTARFNSTSSTAAAAATTTATTTAAEQTPEATIPASDLSDVTVDINSIPEKVGYLKELGLDYGIGPSSMIEFVIEHFHIWGGLPWWASIVGTGLLIRLALLKPMLGAADTSTKINNIKEISTPIRTRMTTLASAGKQVEMMQARAELQKLHQQHGVKAWKTFAPMVQIPLGFGCYRVVKGMTALPVPGLATESVGWIRDLTVADPYFLLPAATAYFMYLSFKKGGESGMSPLTGTALGNMFLYGMPAISFVFMSFFPSALQLYFGATGLFALGQSYLLSNHGFRKWANIAIPKKVVSPAAGGSPTGAEQQSRALRMLTESLEVEKAELFENVKPKARISFIDRAIESLKDSKNKTSKEIGDKMNELRGAGPAKNSDGSPAEPPRLSEKDRRLADDYERRRREEEDWKREERNHARREAHMKALEAEREKAKSSFKAKQR
ncbi:Mitochondrial inner membrane protein oxa1 [Aspergillus nanangensis]|uniref:Mitochondrial inner membrane protein oxa1 n=1 Tax=Aspergillus nanangensis TaxID=2582783 RepID=A0AAD4CCV8_ASPNN|nr:Mitochondrial inner membrane protein oxa1 [Aspergillus nanangensis]